MNVTSESKMGLILLTGRDPTFEDSSELISSLKEKTGFEEIQLLGEHRDYDPMISSIFNAEKVWVW